jgi:hypothetical protein
LSIANQNDAQTAAPAVFTGIDRVLEVEDDQPSRMLLALVPFSGKDENGLTIRGVCASRTDVENVVELGFL